MRIAHLAAAAAACLVVGEARAGLVLTNDIFASDAAFNAATGGTAVERYGAEGRIGGTTTYEYGINKLKKPDPGTFMFGAASGQRTWTAGTTESFTLKYYGDTGPNAGKIEWSIGGSPTITTNAEYFGVGDLYIRTRSSTYGTGNAFSSSVTVGNLKFNASALDAQYLSSASGNQTDYLLIRATAGEFQSGYTLTGEVTMSWTGTNPPNGSNLAFQIKAMPAVVPEPGVMAMGAAGTACLAGLRRWTRRRA